MVLIIDRYPLFCSIDLYKNNVWLHETVFPNCWFSQNWCWFFAGFVLSWNHEIIKSCTCAFSWLLQQKFMETVTGKPTFGTIYSFEKKKKNLWRSNNVWGTKFKVIILVTIHIYQLLNKLSNSLFTRPLLKPTLLFSSHLKIK